MFRRSKNNRDEDPRPAEDAAVEAAAQQDDAGEAPAAETEAVEQDAPSEREDEDGGAAGTTTAFDIVAEAEAELSRVHVAPEGGAEDPEAELRSAIEAICMVSDEPVPAALLAEVLEVSPAKIEEACAELAAGYRAQRRGFVLHHVAGGYRYQSHPDAAAYVERFVLDGQSAKLSGAALETLAIVAYKQPLSRAQISAIRGVNVDGVLKTLQQRGYVAELGQDSGPGQAMLFGTTSLFLEKLGIGSLAELPPLGDFIPGADLVEVLEQGLRPSSAIDLTEDEDGADGAVDEPAPDAGRE